MRYSLLSCILLLLSVILVITFNSFPMVQAQLYYATQEQIIQGSSAYVPFRLELTFPYPSTSVGCSLGRVFMNSTARCTQNFNGIESTGVTFATDAVDTFPITISLNYTAPVNQTAALVVYSANRMTLTWYLPMLGDHILIPIRVITERPPHYPTPMEIAQAGSNQACMDDRKCRELIGDPETPNTLVGINQHISALENAIVPMLAFIAIITLAIGVHYARAWHWGKG